MPDTREEIIEAMGVAIAGSDWRHAGTAAEYVALVRQSPETWNRALVQALAAYEASPLERYRAALEEIAAMRHNITGVNAPTMQDIAERALKAVAHA